MPGTKAGGKKAAATNKKIYGQDFYEKIGAKGGKYSHPLKGFGTTIRQNKEAASRGGKKSRRGKAKPATM